MRHVGDADRLREQLRDAVPVAFAEAKGDIARWGKATELLIDNALEEIEGLRAFSLSTGEVQSIGRTLAQDEGLLASPSEDVHKALRTSTSVFALANAITATARERTDVASRLNLESIGHRYLSAKASLMAASRLYAAILRAAKNGDVRRLLAEALLTVIVVAARQAAEGNDERH
jgi:hypothetical protein